MIPLLPAWWAAAPPICSLLLMWLQPVAAVQLEVTLADESVFVCLEKADVPLVFGAMGTFFERYPCMLTFPVAGRLQQDVIKGIDWL